MAIKESVDVIYTLIDKTKSGFKSIGESLDRTAKKAEELKKKLENVGKIGKILAVGAGAISSAFSFLGFQSLKLAGEVEQQRVAFRGLLGTYSEADKVIARIRKEAARTPFDIPGLTRMTQQLTTVTKDGDKAVDILLDIGNAIALSGKDVVEMERVILNIQQVASTGKLTAMDIRQFQSAIPVFNDILSASGLTTQSLQESSNASELLFKAFRKASEEGGIAFGALGEQSKTLNGMTSTLKDNFGGIIRQLGQGLVPIVKPIIGFFNNLTGRFQELSPMTKTISAVIVSVTIAFTGLVAVLGVFLTLVPILVAGFTAIGVSASIALLGIPIIVTAIVAGFIVLKKNIETIKVKFLNLVDTIKILKNKLFGLNEEEEKENAMLEENIRLRDEKLQAIKDEQKEQENLQKKRDEMAKAEKKRIEEQIKLAMKSAKIKKELETKYKEFFVSNQEDISEAWKIGANAILDVEKKKYIGILQTWMAQQTAIAMAEIATFNPFGIIRLGGVGVAGAGVASINAVKLAKGGSMIVDTPTSILGGRAIVGETGQAERVTVQPITRSDRENSSGQTINLTVNIGEKTIAKRTMKAGYQGRTEGTINDGITIN